MTAVSMTGYGHCAEAFREYTIDVQVRSTNNRHLKLSMRIPDGYCDVEDEWRKIVKTYVRRGSVDVSVQVSRSCNTADIRLDQNVAKGIIEQWKALCLDLEIEPKYSLDALVKVPGAFKRGIDEKDLASVISEVENVLGTTLDEFNSMRIAEGAALEADLRERILSVRELRELILRSIPEIISSAKGKLEERLEVILSSQDVTLDPARIAQEVAILADKQDVTEEIVRLESHCDQFIAILDDSKDIGKRLDFLLQEMNREVNTIASKVSSSDVTAIVVDLKSEIERMREQVQNVE